MFKLHRYASGKEGDSPEVAQETKAPADVVRALEARNMWVTMAEKKKTWQETQRLIGTFAIEQWSEEHGTFPEVAACSDESIVLVGRTEGYSVESGDIPTK